MKKKTDIKELLLFVLIPLVGGALTALLSGGGRDFYETVEKPGVAPPAIVFPIVWSILYILMGVSMYRVWNSECKNRKKALYIFASQLAVNYLWSFIFFDLKAFLFAFIWAVVLWLFVLVMTVVFYNCDKVAGYLQIPYFLWVTFAAYLAFAVYSLNKVT